MSCPGVTPPPMCSAFPPGYFPPLLPCQSPVSYPGEVYISPVGPVHGMALQRFEDIPVWRIYDSLPSNAFFIPRLPLPEKFITEMDEVFEKKEERPFSSGNQARVVSSFLSRKVSISGLGEVSYNELLGYLKEDDAFFDCIVREKHVTGSVAKKAFVADDEGLCESITCGDLDISMYIPFKSGSAPSFIVLQWFKGKVLCALAQACYQGFLRDPSRIPEELRNVTDIYTFCDKLLGLIEARCLKNCLIVDEEDDKRVLISYGDESFSVDINGVLATGREWDFFLNSVHVKVYDDGLLAFKVIPESAEKVYGDIRENIGRCSGGEGLKRGMKRCFDNIEKGTRILPEDIKALSETFFSGDSGLTASSSDGDMAAAVEAFFGHIQKYCDRDLSDVRRFFISFSFLSAVATSQKILPEVKSRCAERQQEWLVKSFWEIVETLDGDAMMPAIEGMMAMKAEEEKRLFVGAEEQRMALYVASASLLCSKREPEEYIKELLYGLMRRGYSSGLFSSAEQTFFSFCDPAVRAFLSEGDVSSVEKAKNLHILGYDTAIGKEQGIVRFRQSLAVIEALTRFDPIKGSLLLCSYMREGKLGVGKLCKNGGGRELVKGKDGLVSDAFTALVKREGRDVEVALECMAKSLGGKEGHRKKALGFLYGRLFTRCKGAEEAFALLFSRCDRKFLSSYRGLDGFAVKACDLFKEEGFLFPRDRAQQVFSFFGAMGEEVMARKALVRLREGVIASLFKGLFEEAPWDDDTKIKKRVSAFISLCERGAATCSQELGGKALELAQECVRQGKDRLVINLVANVAVRSCLFCDGNRKAAGEDLHDEVVEKAESADVVTVKYALEMLGHIKGELGPHNIFVQPVLDAVKDSILHDIKKRKSCAETIEKVKAVSSFDVERGATMEWYVQGVVAMARYDNFASLRVCVEHVDDAENVVVVSCIYKSLNELNKDEAFLRRMFSSEKSYGPFLSGFAGVLAGIYDRFPVKPRSEEHSKVLHDLSVYPYAIFNEYTGMRKREDGRRCIDALCSLWQCIQSLPLEYGAESHGPKALATASFSVIVSLKRGALSEKEFLENTFKPMMTFFYEGSFAAESFLEKSEETSAFVRKARVEPFKNFVTNVFSVIETQEEKEIFDVLCEEMMAHVVDVQSRVEMEYIFNICAFIWEIGQCDACINKGKYEEAHNILLRAYETFERCIVSESHIASSSSWSEIEVLSAAAALYFRSLGSFVVGARGTEYVKKLTQGITGEDEVVLLPYVSSVMKDKGVEVCSGINRIPLGCLRYDYYQMQIVLRGLYPLSDYILSPEIFNKMWSADSKAFDRTCPEAFCEYSKFLGRKYASGEVENILLSLQVVNEKIKAYDITKAGATLSAFLVGLLVGVEGRHFETVSEVIEKLVVAGLEVEDRTALTCACDLFDVFFVKFEGQRALESRAAIAKCMCWENMICEKICGSEKDMRKMLPYIMRLHNKATSLGVHVLAEGKQLSVMAIRMSVLSIAAKLGAKDKEKHGGEMVLSKLFLDGVG
jgi:hypothetical protein